MKAAIELNELLISAAMDGLESLCIDLLARGANVNASGEYSSSPLNEAISRGHLSICQILIDHGADVQSCNYDYHSSPLHIAARNGRTQVVRLLLEHGADVNATNDAGYTPLHWALAAGKTDIYSQLLEHGGDPLIQTKQGQSALDAAVAEGKLDCVRIIKSHLAARAARAALQEINSVSALTVVSP